jgi:hypothetical protein
LEIVTFRGLPFTPVTLKAQPLNMAAERSKSTFGMFAYKEDENDGSLRLAARAGR